MNNNTVESASSATAIVARPVADFLAWRKENRPELRRSGPVGIVHSGNAQTIYGCLCGATHTCATSYRQAKHVERFVSEHTNSCWPVESALG